jgi:cyclopropane fatty-acyl-phospholipid synthase-like methyltransferase
MTHKNNTYLKFDHDEYAKSRAPDDFWGQIRRTINGAPVSDDQIKMIIDTIRSALSLKSDDTLLDIACGNGALSHLLFDSCSEYLGVDLSEHLISVAKANFETLPHYQFIQQGAAEYVRAEPAPESFSKVLCYGSFSYFPYADAAEVLRTLFEKFSSVQTVFIGNLPDKDLASEFYKKQLDIEEMADSCSQIGIWRTRSEFSKLANDAGWKVIFSTMPAGFYSSFYRYDALLSR